ncbi:MAG TPA: rhomboid family intramembrane serine protease [Solirubrobacteraceae bacterium]|nr:rhomboid family intramembrane serine protease [Solirubrobacteraceae bacterium]
MFPLKDNIPNERFPLITVALLALNVIAYLVSLRGGGSFFGGPADTTVVHYGAIPYELTHPGKHCDFTTGSLTSGAGQIICQGQPGVQGSPPGQPATIVTAFTSMFMHGGFLHIAGNMLFLWIFGPNVEDSLGHVRYLGFYLVGGLAALGAQTLIDPGSTVPTLGASGAIAAVLGGYILLFPRARILTLIFIVFFVTIVELPAMLLLGVWFLEQLYFGSAGLTNPVGGSGSVAYFAHIGGFVFGLALVRALVVRHKSEPPRFPVY